jgi:hypothetical protein
MIIIFKLRSYGTRPDESGLGSFINDNFNANYDLVISKSMPLDASNSYMFHRSRISNKLTIHSTVNCKKN